MEQKSICSKGLICIYDGVKGLSILLVRRRNSFQYDSLIMGKDYYRDDDINIGFANRLTLTEKKEFIDGIDFDSSYRYRYRNKLSSKTEEERVRLIADAKDEFDATMDKFMPLIITSYNNGVDGPLPWSIPKGRFKPYEIRKYGGARDCAVREFTEETKIKPDEYEMHYDANSYRFIYDDEGCNYDMEFFFVTAYREVCPAIDTNDNEQIAEVSDLRWMNIESLKNERLDDITKAQLLNRLPEIFYLYSRYQHGKRKDSTYTNKFLGNSTSSFNSLSRTYHARSRRRADTLQRINWRNT
jgi:8-oxo-dGTP pyrophosphatase MutT (NUDIX family)